MPKLQYVTFRESDLGAGIDQQSAENKLAPGFCEDIENADPKSTGQIATRTGYQGYAGYVPVRVQSVDYDGTDIELTLDSSIELPTNQSSPLIILGKTSEASGDFASESIIYFEGFTADIRKTFALGSGTVIQPEADHGISSPLMFVGVAESTSLINNSNEVIIPDSVSIDQTTRDITVGYTNNTGASFEGFVFAKDKSAVAGTTYVQTGNAVSTGSNSFSVLNATHNLDNNNIIVEVYEDVGGDYVRIQADEITLDDSTGDVTIDIENTSGAGYTAVFILTSAPTANFATGAVATGTTATVVIDTSVEGGTDFAFIGCYLEPAAGNDLVQVIPDSIVTDSIAQTMTITFTNNLSVGATFEIYWDFATVITNKLTITGTNSATFTDTAPQLTIWGLCHEEIYGTREAREGWVNHIDSYRAPAENRLICGLGGNLFAARLRLEGTNSTDYLMPIAYPRLNGRLLSDTIVGPAFFDTGETPARTRGYLTGDNGSSNFFEITSIAYNTGTGYIDYTLTVPSLAILDSTGTPTALSSVISTTTGLEDEFTAQQCGYAVHNGTFTIKGVSNPTATTIIISVQNTNLTTTDFDEVDVGGLGGVFTDQLVLTATSPFIGDDIISSDIFGTEDGLTTVNSVGSTLLINSVVNLESLPGGLRVVGTRTSTVVPLRDINNISTVENIVRGDMLNFTSINRELRVKSINQLDDIAITIASDGATATVTMGSGDTTTLFEGKQILIRGTTNYNGTQTITSLLSGTTFTFESSQTTGESGTMVGKTIEIDEALTYNDTTDSSVSFDVDSRWIPIESPTDSFTSTPSTRISYFDSSEYSSQNIIRSTMVQDNLYLTNDDDEVMKFDGTDLYRAGLFRWQPNLFLTTDTTAGGKIVVSNTSKDYDSLLGDRVFRFTTTDTDALAFSEGEIIKDSVNGEVYTVESVDIIRDPTIAGNPTVEGQVKVDKKIDTSGGGAQTLTRTSTFLYYFRLNAVDANDNIIASTVVGSEDSRVELGENAAVNIKLIGLPIFDVYDYDRLEVQIYRTKANSIAPYFRLTTLAMSFNTDDGYIEYTDTASDEDLRDLDEVNTALKGSELGTAWEQPLRAKYCTSSGNRLILGNLKDYPTIDLQILQNVGKLTSAVFTSAGNELWQFRKDNTDTNSGTDMINRARYEFVDSSLAVSSITGTLSTSFSVNAVGHGLSSGDWVYLFHSTVGDADKLLYAGWWQVNSVTDVDNFVVLSANSGSGAATLPPDRMAKASVTSDIPVYLGTDGNYSMIGGDTTTASFEFLAMKRLTNAINVSMRKTDTSLSAFSTFAPWMTAAAGNEFNFGQLIIRQPRIFSTTLELEVPSLTGDFDVFINNVKRAGGSQASSLTRLYPSRIITSYQNYPEIFDNPTAVVDTESDSVIDINSADGQEITAIIPFFGDAAFGSAQKSGIIVVFKTNSVYLVDLAAKDAGQNAVQRLETRGKGCTAPFSVSVTRGGIMFANETGMYRLGRDLKVEYTGRKYERKWKETISKDQLAIATGHHDTESNSYKLSYPLSGTEENSNVAVYNHTREYEANGEGSWTTYTNHPTTGWANLGAQSYFSSTDGRVYIIRRLGELSDYRDDSSAINVSIITRAMDMSESGRRKVFSQIITHYRTVAESSGTTLTAALDLKSVFQDTDAFIIREEVAETGIGDEGTQKIVTIASVIDEKVGIYLQLKYTNSTLDEPIEITGIDIRVAAKSSAGIIQASDTSS